MRKTLRILFVEDVEDKILPVLQRLRTAGYRISWKLVNTTPSLKAALGEESWDLMVSEYALKHLGAADALALIQELQLDIPFLIVSDHAEEADILAAMNQGARDYLTKDNLTRLVPAIERELREAQQRKEFQRLKYALSYSEEKLRALLESAAQAIVISDREGKIVLANATAEKLFQYKREELLGYPVEMLIPPRFCQPHVTHRATYISQPYSRPMGAGLELYARRKDGMEIPVEISLSYTGIDDEFFVMSVINDISERKEIESQFIQAQKMESLGRLASGIAHDFNNLLSVINAYSEMLLMKMGHRDPLRESAEKIKETSQKANILIQQILTFSRKQTIKPVEIDMNRIVERTAGMLERLINKNIELQINLDAHLKKVKIDPVQLEQIIMNLAVNALDALPNGGILTITTQSITLRKGSLDLRDWIPPGDYALLIVEDTGIGMDEKTKEKIFEPFFTTKEKGKGTGLGLSTVYGIVKQNKGDITVHSAPGSGTTFKVYLPEEQETAAPSNSA